MKQAVAFAALLLGGCADSTLLPADEAATFDPVAFFSGRTEGSATLDKIFSAPVAVTVASAGRSDGHGGLILDQIIGEGAKPARQRRWIMTRAGPKRFSGSLTDARGPVDIRLNGPRAVIRYTMKNGMAVEQHLALQRDQATLRNRLTVSGFGIRLASLDETIRKLD